MGIWRRARRRTQEVVEVAGPNDNLSKLFDVSVMVLVAGNILALMLESVQSIADQYGAWFSAFEAASVAVFSGELVLRTWAAAERQDLDRTSLSKRVHYLLSPMALADIAAIAPFYLSSLFAIDLRFMRFLRLLRVLKLTRYSSALGVLSEVLRNQRGAFASAFSVLMLMMIFSASAMFVVEHDAQPEKFSSIPASMWWAVATLTTVGYGDITPITPLGKVVASSITIVGIGMVALPTSILASGFTELQQRRRRMLEVEADKALLDGVISEEESVDYLELADRLGIEAEEAQKIVDLAVQTLDLEASGPHACPHCGKSLTLE